MLKSYLRSAIRNVMRHKGYAFINIAGLTIGLACCMLIAQYVIFQTSFDRFHERGESLYRVVTTHTRGGEESSQQALLGYEAAEEYAANAPEIRRYARIHPEYSTAIVSYSGAAEPRTFKEEGVLYVDSTFFSMFTFPLIQGDASLREPGTIVLTQSAAGRYFGAENPIGKQLEYTGWIDGTFTVAGVIEDVPSMSHLQFDMLLPMQDLLGSDQYQSEGSGWGWSNFIAYVELFDGMRSSQVGPKLTDTHYRFQGENLEARNETAAVALQPLEDVHLDADTFGGPVQSTDPNTVYFFSIVALVTLVIALINYVNLATARAMDRAREVGVRKVVGAHRKQLVTQFLFESVLTNLTALGLALALATAATPLVNSIAGTELGVATWTSGWFITTFGLVFLLGVGLSGLYPAFVLSSFRPAAVLKGKAAKIGGRLGLRKTLVVLQFAASMILLIGTAVVFSQVRFMQNQDLGLSLEQTLIVSGPRVLDDGVELESSTETYAQEVAGLAGVSEFAFSNSIPGRGFNWYSSIRRATADPSTAQDARATGIDHRFLDVYDIDLTVGQPFTENMPPPADGQLRPVLINQAVARALDFSSDDEAVDQIVLMGGAEFIVRGVVDDFNWSSLHQATELVMFQYTPVANNISFKVATSNLSDLIYDIRQQFETVFPGNPFEYTFADEAFAEQYLSDRRFARLFGIFAGLAIFIACLGLFGLAAFTAESRTKEIGVRKVLGASVTSIVALLAREFLLLVGVALVAAVPVAWYFMDEWLASFAYRIELGPGIFVLAGGATLLVAFLTVSYKSIRAASTDPVKSLRYE